MDERTKDPPRAACCAGCCRGKVFRRGVRKEDTISEHVFSQEQVDDAITHVIKQGAENNGAKTYYSLAFSAAGLPAPQDLHNGGESHLVTEFMEAFHRRCLERALPPLDSLVVHIGGPRRGQPGAGYFRVNGQPDPFSNRTSPTKARDAGVFWEQQIGECRTWGVRSRRGQV